MGKVVTNMIEINISWQSTLDLIFLLDIFHKRIYLMHAQVAILYSPKPHQTYISSCCDTFQAKNVRFVMHNKLWSITFN